MKKSRRLTAVLLAVIMVLACSVMSSFAYDRKYDHNNDNQVVYTVLGDSIPAGWSMDGFWDAGKWQVNWPVVPGTYPEYVGKALSADKINMDAHIGLRSADLRYLLDDTYAGDIAVGWRVPTLDAYRTIDPEGLAAVRAQYKADIAEADVITLGIGINDLSIPSGIIDNVMEENATMLLSNWGDMLNNAYKLADNAVYMSQVSALLIGFYRNYCANFDAIVAKIHEINPDAKLYVIGYYNAAQDAYAKGALPVDIGAVVTPFIDLFNSHAADNAAAEDYTYVKMEHIDTVFCDSTSAGYLNDNHPTPYGHQQMAERIMAAIDG